jgi:hypothetical protein
LIVRSKEMSGERLKVITVRAVSGITSVSIRAASSSIVFQPSSKAKRVSRSNRPVWLETAPRPRWVARSAAACVSIRLTRPLGKSFCPVRMS